MKLVIPGPPVPCPLPRVTRHGTYYSDRYKDWLTTVRVAAIAAGWPSLLADGPWTCLIRCYGTHKQADADNVAKGILDALTGILWPSDSFRYVPELRVIWLPVINPRDARTEIEVEALK